MAETPETPTPSLAERLDELALDFDAADDKRTAAARVAHRALDQWIETADRSTR